MAEEYILHRTYCMECDKTIMNSSIAVSRAYTLVESPRNLFERYFLVDRPDLVGGQMLLEESCCDTCYAELERATAWERMQQEALDSLEEHERQLEEYFQNGRWQ